MPRDIALDQARTLVQVDAQRQERSQPMAFYFGVFSLVLVLPFVIFLGVATYQYITSERSKLDTFAMEANADLSLIVDRDLAAVIAALKTLAASPILDDLPRFQLHAREAMAGRQGDLMLLDQNGLDVLDPGSAPLLPAAFVASLLKRMRGPGPAEVSDLIAAMPGQARRVAVSLPVMAPGRPRQVLVFAIRVSHFSMLLQQAGIMPPRHGAIVDRSGAFITRATQNERFVGYPISNFAAMTEASGRVEGITLEGEPVQRHYRRSPVSGWYVSTAVPRAALDAALHRSMWMMAGLAACLALAAVPCAILLTRRMRSAARIAVTAAWQLGRGIPVGHRATGIAEADMVRQALEKASVGQRELTVRLRQANSQLESRVAARTRELADSLALTGSILQSSPDIIQVLDLNGLVMFANGPAQAANAAAAQLAAQDGGVRAGSWAESWPAEYGRAASEAIEAGKNGVSSRFMAWREAGAGTRQWLDVLVTPLVGVGGPTLRLLAISRDVTAQQRRDEELRAAKAHAEAASLAKADFLANMSHEVRTPLNGILGYADLLAADENLTLSQQVRVNRIGEAAMGLLGIVNDILDLPRVEAGDIVIRSRPFCLNNLLARATGTVRAVAFAKGLALHLKIVGAPPPWMAGDPERLTQVLLNLLGNAIKFTEHGSVTLCAEAAIAGPGQCAVTIAVTDTGIGIPHAARHLLFQRFSQLDGSSERRYGGTGLGLAISRRLIESMGGQIEVESEAGCGSTFKIVLTLPVAEQPVSVPKAALCVAAPAGTHVLVVEDLQLNREVAHGLLTALGCRVDVVPSGQAAISAVQQTAYDLVFMDEQMPGMTGTAATRAIRALNHPACDVPIVACSANAFSYQIRRFRDAGMNGHVAKPLTRATLNRVLLLLARGLPLDGLSPADVPPADVPFESTAGQVPEAAAGLDRFPGRSLFSAERLATALASLRHDLVALDSEAGAQPDATALACGAHNLCSTASLLDFPNLALACQAFEASIGNDHDPSAALARLRSATNDAINEIDDAQAGPQAALQDAQEWRRPPAPIASERQLVAAELDRNAECSFMDKIPQVERS